MFDSRFYRFYILIIIGISLWQSWIIIPEILLTGVSVGFVVFICISTILIKLVQFTTTIFTLISSTLVEICVSSGQLTNSIDSLIYCNWTSIQDTIQFINGYLIYLFSQTYVVFRDVFRMIPTSTILNTRELNPMFSLYEVNYIINSLSDLSSFIFQQVIGSCIQLLLSIALFLYVVVYGTIYTILGPIYNLAEEGNSFDLVYKFNRVIKFFIIDKALSSSKANQFIFLVKSFNESIANGVKTVSVETSRIGEFVSGIKNLVNQEVEDLNTENLIGGLGLNTGIKNLLSPINARSVRSMFFTQGEFNVNNEIGFIYRTITFAYLVFIAYNQINNLKSIYSYITSIFAPIDQVIVSENIPTLSDYVCSDSIKLKIDNFTKTRNGKFKNFNLLLTGRPGGGKTYLAKCLSGEYKKPLIYHSGTFVDTYVGTGKTKLQELFDRALSCNGILVLDEFHIVMKHGSYEHETFTLLLHLLENPMYKNNMSVILIGNTFDGEYETSMTEAMLRKGRVDFSLDISRPNVSEMCLFIDKKLKSEYRTSLDEKTNIQPLIHQFIQLTKFSNYVKSKREFGPCIVQMNTNNKSLLQVFDYDTNKMLISLDLFRYLYVNSGKEEGNYKSIGMFIDRVIDIISNPISNKKMEVINGEYFGFINSIYNSSLSIIQAKKFLIEKEMYRAHPVESQNSLSFNWMTAIHELGHAIFCEISPYFTLGSCVLNNDSTLGYVCSMNSSSGSFRGWSEAALWDGMKLAAAGGAAEAIHFSDDGYYGSTMGTASDRRQMEYCYWRIQLLLHNANSETHASFMNANCQYQKFFSKEDTRKMNNTISKVFKETIKILYPFRQLMKKYSYKLIYKGFLSTKEMNDLSSDVRDIIYRTQERPAIQKVYTPKKVKV